MKTINATLYKVDGSKESLTLDLKTSLETLQNLVGGLIEVIHIIPFLEQIRGKFGQGKDLIINEEGRLLDLPINPWSNIIGMNSIWESEQFHGDIVLIEGRLP